MELSSEKKFEKEKYQNYAQMNENTKEGTNTQSQKKNSFNIQEIKAYLEKNNNLSNEYDPHLITDVNNNFSSRKELFLSESDSKEDLVMNQSYNYNPNLSNYSSKITSQNILQISQNKNENFENSEPNNNYILHSEKKVSNPKFLVEITTKKSTKTTASKKDKENLVSNGFSYDEGDKEGDICNTFDEEKNDIKKEESECINNTLDKNKEEVKITEKSNEKNYLQSKKIEKEMIDNKDNEDEILEIKEDIFGKYVDNIIKRSYRVYKNRQCPSCAVLLSKGKSCIKCPKYHHLIKTGK